MTEHLRIRREGRAGRITLARPQALNALDPGMVAGIDAALRGWAAAPEIAVVIVDAQGPRAFCAGGDVAAVWRQGRAGDFASGARFWRDEYRMNARIAEYPKPVVAFMHGFTMGGGVGVGGHARHRIVGESTQIAMPETAIGLVPDVGGTLLLARAPGRLGEYLGLSGARMGPADAILAGFADRFVPEAQWPGAIAALCAEGLAALPGGETPPEGTLAALRPQIDAAFGAADARAIAATLEAMPGAFAAATAAGLRRVSALSLEATLRLVRAARRTPTLRAALSNEFRFTARAAEQAEFLEGVRAQIIDKDRAPRWRWSLETLPAATLEALLAPLPPEWEIDFD